MRVYGSWYPAGNLFVDADAGFDGKTLDTRRIVALKVVSFGAPGYPGIVGYDPAPAPATSSAHERGLSGSLRVGDWLDLRVSAAAVFAHGISAFASLESTAGNRYIGRYQASAGLRVEL